VNVLLLDGTGSFLDFALRVNKAGHYSRTCMAYDQETGQRKKVGDGLIEKIEREEWQRHVDWADLILMSDNNKWLRELDVYRGRGYPVLAPSYESAQLELNRGLGQKFLADHGIATVPYESFSDYAKAEEHVRQHMERVVCKPDGDRPDKSLSYCAKSPKDMVFMLQRWAGMPNLKVGKFMLQEFVEGIEFSVAGWIGPNGFLPWFEENWEHKKLMNDEYGPNTGEMGTCCKYVKDSPLAKELLLPLEKDLVKMGCGGSVCVSAIIDKDGEPRPTELTVRFGWPSFNICQALHPEPVEWMANWVDGEDTFEPLDGVATGVVMAIPPFPHKPHSEKEIMGIPIYGLDNENQYRDMLCPCELESGTAPEEADGELFDKRMFVSCGDYLVVATGRGPTVRESADAAYAAASSIEIPNDVEMRTDIGDRLKKEIPKLQDYGFATDWRY
jgi:phosphoribosylamine--glycine ligase